MQLIALTWSRHWHFLLSLDSLPSQTVSGPGSSEFTRHSVAELLSVWRGPGLRRSIVSPCGLRHGSGCVCVGVCTGQCWPGRQGRGRRRAGPRLSGDTRSGTMGRLRRHASGEGKRPQACSLKREPRKTSARNHHRINTLRRGRAQDDPRRTSLVRQNWHCRPRQSNPMSGFSSAPSRILHLRSYV